MSYFYRVSPELVMERFTGAALVLLASQDRFLTVNQSAADVLTLMQDSFAERPFSCDQLAALLLSRYRIAKGQAQKEASDILSRWSREGILIASQPT
jgi:hypothetical protein